LLVGFHFRGKLRGDKQFLPIHAACSDPYANAVFIAICLRGIDMSVTQSHGIFDRLSGDVVAYQPGS